MSDERDHMKAALRRELVPALRAAGHAVAPEPS
jgi:hypothetical protein